jgi:hypothetical protein
MNVVCDTNAFRALIVSDHGTNHLEGTRQYWAQASRLMRSDRYRVAPSLYTGVYPPAFAAGTWSGRVVAVIAVAKLYAVVCSVNLHINKLNLSYQVHRIWAREKQPILDRVRL